MQYCTSFIDINSNQWYNFTRTNNHTSRNVTLYYINSWNALPKDKWRWIKKKKKRQMFLAYTILKRSITWYSSFCSFSTCCVNRKQVFSHLHSVAFFSMFFFFLLGQACSKSFPSNTKYRQILTDTLRDWTWPLRSGTNENYLAHEEFLLLIMGFTGERGLRPIFFAKMNRNWTQKKAIQYLY